MKKLLLIPLCIIPLACRTWANDTTSHTYYSEQNQFDVSLPTKSSLFYDGMDARQHGMHAAIQVVPFASISTNWQEVARFFFPFGKAQLNAGEFYSNTARNDTVDIMANYFGVLTRPVSEVYGTGTLDIANLTFESIIRIKPQQKVTGIGLTYRQRLNNFDDPDKGWWAEISLPIMHVQNDLRFTETIINKGGGEVPEGFVGSIGDALRGKTVFGSQNFNYGKISDCPLNAWGVADLEISVGHDNNSCKEITRRWFAGLVIPTGNRPKGEYVFEAIVGNNHHWGLTFGGEYDYAIWTNPCENKRILFHINTYSQYLFKNIQRRSMDLVDKQWSRYIWMYDKPQAEANILDIVPGINILTRDVFVYPRSSFNNNVSFEFACDCGFVAEVGYSTYYRQGEYVDLVCPFPDGPVIAGFNAENTTQFVTESSATMPHFLDYQGITYDKTLDLTDPDEPEIEPRIVMIKDSDIDRRSAAHPCIVSHIVWATAGYRWDNIETPCFLALGGNYEFSGDNNALERWTVWGKFGISL